MKKIKTENWLDEFIEFYDFVWKTGMNMCAKCCNKELLQDFQNGGNQFEEMKKAIVKKFPTYNKAKEEYNLKEIK